MKRVLSLVLALVMVLGMIPMGFAADQTAGEILKGYKIIEGYEDGSLGEDNHLNRAEMMVVLARMMGKGEEAKAFALPSSFTDLEGFGWAVPWIAYAELNEWTAGVGAGKFNPAGEVTLQEAAVFMLKALGYVADTDFTWANAVEVATAKSLLAGVSVAHTNAVKRGELFTVMINTLNTEVKDGSALLGVKLGYMQPAVFAVKSATQHNAKQIKVEFTKTLNKASAETIGNYYLNGSALGAGNEADLQDDGKTVIVTLANALVNNSAYAFKVADVRDSSNVALPSSYTVSILASDKVAPTFASASAKAKTTTTTIKLTFNEPIDYSVAAVTVNGTFAALSAGSTAQEVVVTTGTNLIAGVTYNLNIMNFKDFAGNFMATNPLAATVTVVSDTAAPVVQSAVFTRDNLLTVTFDKAMNIATLTNNVNVKLLNNTLADTGALGAPVKADSSNKVFEFAVTGLTFNSSNVFTGVVVLNTSVADTSGNALANPATFNVSVTKDTAKPAVVSVEYKQVANYGTQNSAGTPISTPYGAVIVKFNEDVVVPTTPPAFTIIDNNGSAVTAPSATTVNYSNETELVVALGASVASGISNYLVLVPSGAVTDLSLAANTNVATQHYITVTPGTPTSSDTTAPSVSSVLGASTTATAGQTITVNFVEAGSGLDLATVVNTNNYRLDGLPLPAGSYVTVSELTVTINIPAGSIAKDKTVVAGVGGYIFNVTGVKDKAGNSITPFVGLVTLKDDIKPEMTAAVINSNGTLTISFSEDVVPASAATVNDFKLTVNGTEITTGISIVDGVGSDDGKYVLSVAATDLTLVSTVKIETVATPATVKDLSSFANVLKGSKSITVK